MRGNNLQVGDKIVAVYDRTAPRRQAAGHRSGDPVVTGAFVSVPEITVEEVRPTLEGLDVRFRDNWYGPYSDQDMVEVIRAGEVL